MDLLVGIWAEKRVPELSEENLHQFELILDQENPDLYKWLTGQEQPPTDIARNTAYQVMNLPQLCNHVSELHTRLQRVAKVSKTVMHGVVTLCMAFSLA